MPPKEESHNTEQKYTISTSSSSSFHCSSHFSLSTSTLLSLTLTQINENEYGTVLHSFVLE
jgi:hypothetical protein